MLKIYETMQSSASNHIKIAIAILFVSLAVGAIATFKVKPFEHKKIIDLIWATSVASALFSLFAIIGIAAIDSGDVSRGPLNKDQYQLKVINNQIIKTDNDKYVMKIDDKEFDAFKILAITDDAYVVEGASKDNSLHKVFELKKADHNFKEESN